MQPTHELDMAHIEYQHQCWFRAPLPASCTILCPPSPARNDPPLSHPTLSLRTVGTMDRDVQVRALGPEGCGRGADLVDEILQAGKWVCVRGVMAGRWVKGGKERGRYVEFGAAHTYDENK